MNRSPALAARTPDVHVVLFPDILQLPVPSGFTHLLLGVMPFVRVIHHHYPEVCHTPLNELMPFVRVIHHHHPKVCHTPLNEQKPCLRVIQLHASRGGVLLTDPTLRFGTTLKITVQSTWTTVQL
jgi:hypothetical protein